MSRDSSALGAEGLLILFRWASAQNYGSFTREGVAGSFSDQALWVSIMSGQVSQRLSDRGHMTMLFSKLCLFPPNRDMIMTGQCLSCLFAMCLFVNVFPCIFSCVFIALYVVALCYLIYSFIYLFQIYSFIHLFIYSFIYLLIYLFIY